MVDGPFVYRLGPQIFILVRGVRFPYGLQKLQTMFAAFCFIVSLIHKDGIFKNLFIYLFAIYTISPTFAVIR